MSALYCIVLYCIVLYCIVLYCIVLYWGPLPQYVPDCVIDLIEAHGCVIESTSVLKRNTAA